MDKIQIGERIKTARKVFGVLTDQKITQEKLGELVNQSRSYIGDIESGRTYPTLSVLFEISSLMGIPIEYFVSENFSLEDLLLSPQTKSKEEELIERYKKLSEVNKATVWSLIESLEIIDRTQREQANATEAC